MNRKVLFLSLALAFVLAAATFAGDDSTQIKGTLLCAKCALHEEGATTCQNVVQVKNDKGESMNYYVVKNEVAEKFGHVCKGSKDVVVTGKVSDKDGKKWIEPSKMDEVKSS